MVEIHVRFLEIIWFSQTHHFFHHIHAIGWCSCRYPLEPFNSGKRSSPRGLRFALLKICNVYRQLHHRGLRTEKNLWNDQIRIQLIFRYFVPLDEVIADIGESRWVHKMKELINVFHCRYSVSPWDCAKSIYGCHAFDRIVSIIVIMSWRVPLSWARAHTLNNMAVQYGTT